jgi:hypothetical protein
MPVLNTLRYIKNYVSHLNPEEVRGMANRPLAIGLVASGNDGYLDMEEWLAPLSLSAGKREEVLASLHRAGDPGAPTKFDLVLYEQGLPCPASAYTFFRNNPDATVAEVVKERNDITIPLAARFAPFRGAVSFDIVQRVARENALFTIATGVPFLMPVLGLGYAVGEFASDTAFLTINQIRMAFLLAAANDRTLGYGEQKAELASIVTSAFGLRAIARELVGKLRFAGGVIPKGAIAYAGTFVMGLALERLYRVGYDLSREERSNLYAEALEFAQRWLHEWLPRRPQPRVA